MGERKDPVGPQSEEAKEAAEKRRQQREKDIEQANKDGK